MKQITPFGWTIIERQSWPPSSRPQPPFGPTTVEIVRSCPLRGCFEASSGYERRQDFSARIGAAFHRTIQYANSQEQAFSSLDEIISRTISTSRNSYGTKRQRLVNGHERSSCHVMKSESNLQESQSFLKREDSFKSHRSSLKRLEHMT